MVSGWYWVRWDISKKTFGQHSGDNICLDLASTRSECHRSKSSTRHRYDWFARNNWPYLQLNIRLCMNTGKDSENSSCRMISFEKLITLCIASTPHWLTVFNFWSLCSDVEKIEIHSLNYRLQNKFLFCLAILTINVRGTRRRRRFSEVNNNNETSYLSKEGE